MATRIDKDDLARLRHLVKEFGGNYTRIAEALGITRQGARARLKTAGLLEQAERLRNETRAPGNRTHLSDADRKAERERILDALAAAEHAAAAGLSLGLSHATIYRKIEFHAITDAEIEKRRDQQLRARQRATRPARSRCAPAA